jgi:hypothetical protein
MAGEPAPAAPPAPGSLTGVTYAPPAPPAKVDRATYDKMTVGERHNYAKQFPQPTGDRLPAADPPAPTFPPVPGDASPRATPRRAAKTHILMGG